MEMLLMWSGRLAGIAGVVVCVLSGLMRVGGRYVWGGYELLTLMQAGMAGMILGSFCILVALTMRPKRDI